MYQLVECTRHLASSKTTSAAYKKDVTKKQSASTHSRLTKIIPNERDDGIQQCKFHAVQLHTSKPHTLEFIVRLHRTHRRTFTYLIYKRAKWEDREREKEIRQHCNNQQLRHVRELRARACCRRQIGAAASRVSVISVPSLSPFSTWRLKCHRWRPLRPKRRRSRFRLPIPLRSWSR